MAFFAKSTPTSSGPVPLTIDRVADVLEARECSFGWSSDRASVGGFWGDHLMEFLLYGEHDEVLQVRAHWGRPLGVDQRPAVLDALNAHASGRLWPKAYVDVDDDGELLVLAEHAIDYEHGVTDEQLDLHLACALNASLGLFEELDRQFPAAVAAWRAAQAADEGADSCELDHDHDHDAHDHDDHDHGAHGHDGHDLDGHDASQLPPVP
jgi:hypothetical protein